jgi:hypothetical protein
MSTSVVADMPDILPDTIECPSCNGRGRFSRMQVLESLGIKNDGLTEQVWSLEELVEVLVSRRRREQQIADEVGDCAKIQHSTPGSNTVQTQLRPTSFTHRENEDLTIDSICKSCCLVVARALEERDLEQMELRHVCQPVERREHIRTVHRTYSYHVKV